jgi:2,3-bisphosphoglycerate-independent phosphoglycerate mutase
MFISERIISRMKNKKALLMILDGWGIGDGSVADVISQVPTPNLDYYKKNYPSSRLHTSGEDVGLPEGQMGNSEVEIGRAHV